MSEAARYLSYPDPTALAAPWPPPGPSAEAPHPGGLPVSHGSEAPREPLGALVNPAAWPMSTPASEPPKQLVAPDLGPMPLSQPLNPTSDAGVGPSQLATTGNAHAQAPTQASLNKRKPPTNSHLVNHPNPSESFLAILLPGEDSVGVPVFDTCQELRAKIRAFLAANLPVPGQTDKHGNPKPYTRAQLVRDLGVNTNTLRRFMNREHHPMGGAELGAYYQSYCFFEKIRLYNGELKSAARLEREEKHPTGLELKDPTLNRPVWVFVAAGENPNDHLSPTDRMLGTHFPDFPPAGCKVPKSHPSRTGRSRAGGGGGGSVGGNKSMVASAGISKRGK